MELSVREAATLCGKSPRTLRAQLARGELPGVKRNGRWRVDRRHLPLTEAQRRALQARADGVRRLVEDALPSRTATKRGEPARSLADLDAFRVTVALMNRVSEDAKRDTSPTARRLETYLRRAALMLAETFHQFDPRLKLEAVNRARSQLARATAVMLIDGGDPISEPAFTWLTVLEREVIPTVGGLARAIDRLGARS
jgi:hypothetical protein